MHLPPEIVEEFGRVAQAAPYTAIVVVFPEEMPEVIPYDEGDPLAGLEEAIRRDGRPIGILAIRDTPCVRGQSTISFTAPRDWPRGPEFEALRARIRDFLLDFARARGLTAYEVLPERN